MKIYKVSNITDRITSAFAKLIPQLDPNLEIPDRTRLDIVIKSDNSLLFVAENDEEIVGTLSLVIYAIPSGTKAWIEDVIVDESMRGKGVARQLIDEAVKYAQKVGIKKVDLTSRPFRVGAHALYKKCGFVQRETLVFRLMVD